VIEGPIKTEEDFIELATGEIFTVLSGNEEGVVATETVLEILGTEQPAIVYYSQANSTTTIICTEGAFRERFERA